MTCARRTLTAQTVGCVMVVLAKANDDKIGKSDQAAAPAQTNRAHHEPYSTKASFADAGTAHTGRVDFPGIPRPEIASTFPLLATAACAA